jgi:hypothetical protein
MKEMELNMTSRFKITKLLNQELDKLLDQFIEEIRRSERQKMQSEIACVLQAFIKPVVAAKASRKVKHGA